MPALEQTTIEILRLEAMWQNNEGAHFPWVPFDDHWTIDSETLAPHTRLTDARKIAEPTRIPVPLTAQCADVLRAVWNGEASAIVGAKCFHQYSFAKSKSQFWRMWIEHPQRHALSRDKIWTCNNLKDAGEKYSWTGDPLEFPLLALALQVAVSQGDHLHAAAICLRILYWGGVRKRGNGMEKWLCRCAHEGTLCRNLVDATARLIPQSCEPLDTFDGETYLMNSSSTKLYAAMALDLSDGLAKARQDVLIYDGRVAAGLAFITRVILAGTGVTKIPDDLLFPVDVSHDDKRDPSSKRYKFPNFTYDATGHRARAQFARIGSQYIETVLDIHKPSIDFALAEKGLFMIGYDVRHPQVPTEMANEDVRGIDRLNRRAGAASEEFIRRAMELHESGMPQRQAVVQAGSEFNIDLPDSYIKYPGSHFGRWRKQGYFV